MNRLKTDVLRLPESCMLVRYHVAVLAYCVSCSLLHSLLTTHFIGHCGTWLSFGETGYCSIVRKTLAALRTSPLLIASAVIAGAPLQHAAWRQDGADGE